jgi:hypothetical protein
LEEPRSKRLRKVAVRNDERKTSIVKKTVETEATMTLGGQNIGGS